ncbi:unnamed protein product [Rhodiola kirilowii]
MEPAKDSTYDDFEPYCKWERDESQDVLIVHLPDFKRNELKIQINKYGLLTVSGECQPAKGVSKISRFTKRIRISRDYYDEDQIHAKFISGILYITMPQKVTRSKNVKNSIKGNVDNTDDISEMPPLEDTDEVREPGNKQKKLVKKNVMETVSKEMSYAFGLITDREKGKKVAVVASAVAVSSLGAYAMYKFWSGSQKT